MMMMMIIVMVMMVMLQVRAVRDMGEGDEITANYVDR